jgi:hypothetical protein
MKKLVETWLLKTVDGRDVHMDSSGTVRYKETFPIGGVSLERTNIRAMTGKRWRERSAIF